MTFIYGGSRAGKSTYVERLVAALPNRDKIFIAAMAPHPDFIESVARQQRERAEEGFTATIEAPFDLELAAERVPEGAAVIVECLCHLCSNELFRDGAADTEAARQRILRGIDRLRERCELYLVSNEIAADGVVYDEETRLYQRLLAQLNRDCAARAECVVEVVCGIPMTIKSRP